VGIDLKHPEAVELVLRLVEQADGLVEGFRPGVAERLGWGPMPAGPGTGPSSTGA
jgi:alpha-methylacyl-CoA racemase